MRQNMLLYLKHLESCMPKYQRKTLHEKSSHELQPLLKFSLNIYTCIYIQKCNFVLEFYNYHQLKKTTTTVVNTLGGMNLCKFLHTMNKPPKLKVQHFVTILIWVI